MDSEPYAAAEVPGRRLRALRWIAATPEACVGGWVPGVITDMTGRRTP